MRKDSVRHLKSPLLSGEFGSPAGVGGAKQSGVRRSDNNSHNSSERPAGREKRERRRQEQNRSLQNPEVRSNKTITNPVVYLIGRSQIVNEVFVGFYGREPTTHSEVTIPQALNAEQFSALMIQKLRPEDQQSDHRRSNRRA
jgi:hypothetical protein